MSEVEQFARLFRGRTDVIGHAKGHNGPISDRRPVTLVDYEQHLAGDGTGIGIYPMLPDATVWFAAIDLDEPDFELARTMQKLIPGQSWIERSKSGNAHVWVFFEQPVDAWAARTILRGATQSVGRSEVEIFPKQDGLRDDMIGNFINLPYHGDSRPILWWDSPSPPGTPEEETVREAWLPLTLNGFIETARTRLQDPEAWVRRARALGGQPPEEREAASEFGEQPNLHMCAEYIMERRFDNPLTPGHRSTVLFNLARQFLNWRDCSQEEARRWVHEVNDAGTSPAPASEVDRQFDNALNGKWTGTGCDDPVMLPYVHPDCPIAKGEVGR